MFSCSPFTAESVYDLLPKELQLQPPSTQTDPPTMSQKSGGEAGPTPSTALAAGEQSYSSYENHDLGSVTLLKRFPSQQGQNNIMALIVWGQLHPFISVWRSLC